MTTRKRRRRRRSVLPAWFAGLVLESLSLLALIGLAPVRVDTEEPQRADRQQPLVTRSWRPTYSGNDLARSEPSRPDERP